MMFGLVTYYKFIILNYAYIKLLYSIQTLYIYCFLYMKIYYILFTYFKSIIRWITQNERNHII